MRRNADLLVCAGLAMLALLLTLLGLASGPLRLALGLLLVLVLPGYTLAAAAFPTPTLARSERLLYTGGLSLIVTILGGFVLNWLPWGLQPTSWALLLSYVTLGGSIVALVRRAPITSAVQRAPIRLGGGQALLLGLAALAVVGALLVAQSEAAQRPAPDVVQLWMLPGASGASVRLGVITSGPVGGDYRLVLQRGGYTLREWPALRLADADRWQATVELPARQSGRGPLEARLERIDRPGVERQVQLWLDQPTSQSKRN